MIAHTIWATLTAIANLFVVTKMRYLILLIFLFTISVQSAEIKGKIGYSDALCRYLQSGIDVAVSVEQRVGIFAGELEIGFENHKIAQVGQVNTLKTAFLAKLYVKPDVWIGVGVGWLDNYVVESYDGQADIDDEVAYLAVIGKSWGNWFVEVQARASDLDLETDLPYETNVEKHSRLDSITFKIGYKW